jgi:hypothetical protein
LIPRGFAPAGDPSVLLEKPSSSDLPQAEALSAPQPHLPQEGSN